MAGWFTYAFWTKSDKKAIQQRIETRLNKGGSGKARSDTTAASSDANFERVN